MLAGRLNIARQKINYHLVGLESAAERAAFSHDLVDAVTKIVSRYHDAAAPRGRAHRVMVVAHPLPYKCHIKERT